MSILALLIAAVVVLGIVRAGDDEAGGSSGEVSRAPGLAVFPFVVRGTDDRYGVGDGVVDLLSASLDGFESWRTIDPRAVYGAAGEEPGDLDPETGARLADRLGARYYLLGSVVGEGRRLRVTASLYDRRSGLEPVTTARAEGLQNELFRLVDQLAAELATQGIGTPRPLDRVAATSTESLAALRLYLSGTRAIRDGDFDEAVDYLEMSIRADTTFALAAYQLRLAADASGSDPEALSFANRIMETHLDRLPERIRRLAEARLLHYEEGPFAAETAYRDILARRPDEVEAWYQLADLLFHYAPLRGESFAASGPAFMRVLEVEPGHLEAILHLARIAAWRRDRDRLDSLTRRGLDEAARGDVRLELLALRGVVLDDREALAEVVETLERTADGRVWIVATRTAVYSGMPDASRPLYAALLEPTRPDQARAMAHVAHAHLDLAGGRVASAARALEKAARISPEVAAPYRLWLASFPFFTGRCETVADLPTPEWDATGSLPLPKLSTMNPARRGALDNPLPEVVFEALVDACHERFTPALAAAARIETRGGYGPEYAELVRLHVAWAGGPRPTEGTRKSAQGTTVLSPLARTAWIAGEIALGEGRPEEALGWYRAVVRDLEIGSLPYYGPAELRKAEALDRLGRVEEARSRYRRFLELWEDADPALRPYVEDARKRLSELEG